MCEMSEVQQPVFSGCAIRERYCELQGRSQHFFVSLDLLGEIREWNLDCKYPQNPNQRCIQNWYFEFWCFCSQCIMGCNSIHAMHAVLSQPKQQTTFSPTVFCIFKFQSFWKYWRRAFSETRQILFSKMTPSHTKISVNNSRKQTRFSFWIPQSILSLFHING